MTEFKRIFQLGWEKFLRDKTSSSAAVVVMTIVVLLATFLFFVRGAGNFVIASLENSVDVSVYFKEDAAEEDTMKLRSQLLTLPEVQDVRYVSKDEALKTFTAAHQQDQLILESLQSIGSNPFLASLDVKAKNTNDYAGIADFLQKNDPNSLIANIDYNQRAPVIEKVVRFISGMKTGILALSLIFGLIAVLVAFNTTRLTMYASKEEIEIMRLVGASNWFIRGPFLVYGMLAGLLGALVVFALLIPLVFFLSPRIETFTLGFRAARFLWSNVAWIVLLQAGVGMALGFISSAIAIRKYLKI